MEFHDTYQVIHWLPDQHLLKCTLRNFSPEELPTVLRTHLYEVKLGWVFKLGNRKIGFPQDSLTAEFEIHLYKIRIAF